MSLPSLGLEEGLVYATEELYTERGVSHTLPGWGPTPCQSIDSTRCCRFSH